MNISSSVLAVLIPAAMLSAEVPVTGRVVDENGLAVAGARLEFRSDHSQPVPAVSDAAGLFAVRLDPGAYTLRAEREGFFVLSGRSLTLTEAGTQITVALNHQRELAESVEVQYSPPAIDAAETAEKKQLNQVEIAQVPYPASQDLRNALPLFHGVVQDAQGRVHVNGGASNQTNVTLDGFNVSDPVTGRLDARLNVDTVRSLDLETTRFSADKGRASAGSLDIRTNMGDDRWRFSGTNFIPGVSTESGLHVAKWTPRVGVSGPIARGRAWFHNGTDLFYDVNVISGLPKGDNQSRSTTMSNLTRFQVNLKPGNILTAGLLINHVNAGRNGLSFLSPIETTLDRRQNLAMATIKDQIYLGRGALVEFGFADSRTVTRESPRGDELFEILPSGRRGNYFVDLTRHSGRRQWTANATLPPARWFGSHQLRFGADVQRETFDQASVRHDYRVLRLDSSVARHVTFGGSGLRAKSNFDTALFLQDRWTPADGLLVEAGLRSGWDEVTRQTRYSPRLAAAWAPRRLRETKLSAGYGVFYDAMNLGSITQHQDQVSFSTFFAPDGSIRRGPVETGFHVDEQALRASRYQSLSFSLERKLPLGFHGKAGYASREGRRGLTYVNTWLPAVESVQYRLANARKDRYDALELTARRTFGGKFQWAGGYTRSSARSNAAVDYSIEDPVFALQEPGPHAWDTPHRFLTWGWAPLPKLGFVTRATEAAYLAEYHTGFPFSVVNEEGFQVGQPNQRRLPSYFNLNLHFERKFHAAHALWAWRFGFNNLTNNGNPNVVNNNVDSPYYLVYGRGQRRAFAVRLRFLGKR